MPPVITDEREAVEALKVIYEKCGSVLVLAGAGMGVDGGVGTFRGSAAGVWPGMADYDLPLAPDGSIGLSQLNDKKWFGERPGMAWEFWRWCHENYTANPPHGGYAAVRKVLEEKPGFVVTTNIDSQFVRSGVGAERVREVHGVVGRVVCSGMGRENEGSTAIGGEADLRPLDFAEDFEEGEVFQGTTTPCGHQIPFSEVPVDEAVPRCPCGAVLRPDVVLFGDVVWPNNPPPGPLFTQLQAYTIFLTTAPTPILILEVGAGTAMPFLRKISSTLRADRCDETYLVRVNPEEAGVEDVERELGVACRARPILEGLVG